MKLVTYRQNSTENVGVLLPGDRIVPVSALGLRYHSMNELITGTKGRLFSGLLKVAESKAERGECLRLQDVVLLAPIPRPMQDVICLGVNYAAHAQETAHLKGEDFSKNGKPAVYFSKRVSEATAPGAKIPDHSAVTKQVDYEAELALIIGKDAENVSPKDAQQYIFGYTVLNDVTARDVQYGHTQWYFGKSLDGYAPMGPCIVTADEVAYPPALEITCSVNGELRQKSSTSCLIHGVGEIISELSHGMTLKAGTIISTGTPAGVAVGMEQPKWLRSGDVIECTVEGIGTLRNVMA